MECVEVVRLTSDVLATLHICICGHVAQRRASAEQKLEDAGGLPPLHRRFIRRQSALDFDVEGSGDAFECASSVIKCSIDPLHRHIDAMTRAGMLTIVAPLVA